jgi:ribonuclease BN (tRNA processing enzyme)
MKLIVLGSGTCVPSLTRNAPGYLLEAEGKQVLVDCGSGTLLQLEKAGRSFRDIDAVFITHLHPDHFADLMPLIHALVSVPGFKREKELLIAGPEGLTHYYEDAFVPIIHRQEFIRFIEMKNKLKLDPFSVHSSATVHIRTSLAFRFEVGEKSIVFSGDADYDQGLIDISKDADILIADSSFPHSKKGKGHLSSLECGLVAKKAGVKRLLLSHLYPDDLPDSERLKECREVFSGEVELAEDLMEIEI